MLSVLIAFAAISICVPPPLPNSDYFFGRFADVTSPIKKTEDAGKVIEEKRVINLSKNKL